MQPPRKAQKKTQSDEVLDLESVWLSFGGQVGGHANWTKVKCIVHGERQASCTINLEIGIFKCFSCDAKGDALSLIRLMEQCSYPEALKKYKEITGQEAKPGRTSTYSGNADAVESSSEGSFLLSRLRGRQ